jgi:hypothetical protein
MPGPAKIRMTAQQREYVSALLGADSAFADLICSHPNVRIEDNAITLEQSDAATLSDYFSDRLPKVGFDANYQPNEEGELIEGLIDALFSVVAE